MVTGAPQHQGLFRSAIPTGGRRPRAAAAFHKRRLALAIVPGDGVGKLQRQSSAAKVEMRDQAMRRQAPGDAQTQDEQSRSHPRCGAVTTPATKLIDAAICASTGVPCIVIGAPQHTKRYRSRGARAAVAQTAAERATTRPLGIVPGTGFLPDGVVKGRITGNRLDNGRIVTPLLNILEDAML